MTKQARRPAFTMVELVFAIVIIGILAAVAIPRLAASRDDAEVAKGRSDISSIRSSIALDRSQRLMEGNTTMRTTLDEAAANSDDGQALFGNILDYPILAGKNSGKWKKGVTNGNDITYSFNLNGTWVNFNYNTASGRFLCEDLTDADDSNDEDCLLLTR